MAIYDVDKQTYQEEPIDSKLDVRAIIGYSLNSCDIPSGSSDTDNKRRIVEIVVPVVVGVLVICYCWRCDAQKKEKTLSSFTFTFSSLIKCFYL